MRMSEQSFEGAQPPIDAYAPGGFRVRGAFKTGPLLLSPRGLEPWPVGDGASAEAVDETRMAALLSLAGAVDVLLIGMGPEIRHLDAALEQRLFDVGLGVEPMSTPSACRSYNVALAEDRRVAVALMPT